MADGAALAGRARELGTVAATLTGTSESAALLVVGEPGVGKSRLVAVGMAEAAAADVLVLPGWCLALSTDMPFTPVIEALRALLAADAGRWMKDAVSECPRFVRAEIGRLLPELDDGEDPPPSPGAPVGGRGVDGWQQQRLFEAVRRLLAALAQLRQVAVVIEDLHWADSTTLAFLELMLAPGGLAKVPLVLSCRADEPLQAGVLGWLARVQRNSRVRRLDLAPLSEAETGEQIGMLLGHRPSTELVHRIFARSDGNAFFTEQLISAAADDAAVGGDLPVGLTALLLDRTAPLTGAAREVVTGLAVAGVPLHEHDLATLCARDRGDVREAVRALTARRLLRRPDTGGRYQLRHALLAEAVSADLLPDERTDWHLRAAELLTSRNDRALAAQIAEHYATADCRADELRWRVTAARHAGEIFAAAEAAAHWQKALELCRDAPPNFAVDGITLTQIYSAAEDAAEASGPDDVRARELAEEALSRLVDVPAADRADVLSRAGWLRVRANQADGLDLMREAEDLYRRQPPTSGRVRNLECLAVYFLNFGQEARTRQTLHEAAVLAELVGDRAARLRIGTLLANRDVGNPAAEKIQKLRDELTDADPPDLHAYLAVGHTSTLGMLGRHEAAAGIGRVELARAAQTGIDQSFTVNVLRANTVESLLELGAVDDAAQLIEPVTRGAPEPATQFNYVAMAHIELLRGHRDEAHRRWAQLHEASPIALFMEIVDACWELEMHLWDGDAALAYASVTSLLNRLLDTDDGIVSDALRSYAATLLNLGVRACADLAGHARAIGRRDALTTTLRDAVALDRLRRRMRPDPFVRGPARPTAGADAALWRAERSRPANTNPPELWRHTADAWTEHSRPHRAAYARWRQAEAMLAEPGARGAAGGVLRDAAQLARGHTPLSDAIADLAHRARVDLTITRPPADRSATAPPPSTSALGLTDRELAVLRLVADGHSNAEIGATLFISTKTASVHVTHILRKLDVATRVQAAAVAARAGLLTEPAQAGSLRPRRPAGR